MKICNKCNENKSLDDFYKKKSKFSQNSRTSICKICWSIKAKKYRFLNKEKLSLQKKIYREKYPEKIKSSMLKNSFEIDLDIYNKMFLSQNGCCAICFRHQSLFKKALCVDHNHETKEVRGLLCKDCNTGIGFLQDNPTIISQAQVYLNRSKIKLAAS